MEATNNAVAGADRLLLRSAVAAPGWFALAVFATIATAVCALVLPATLAGAVDAAITGTAATSSLMALAAVLLADVALTAAQTVAGAACGAGAASWLRGLLVRHVLALGVRGQQRYASGDLTTRLVGSSTEAGQAVLGTLHAVVSAATGVGGVVALWAIDWRLAAAFVVGVPPALFIIRIFVVRTSGMFARYQEIQGAIAGRLAGALGGARTIRASGTSEREIDRILAPLPQLSQTGLAIWSLQRSAVWQVALLLPLVEIIVLAVAGLSVVAGRISPGELLASAGYVMVALGFLDQIDGVLGVARARAGAQRVIEVLHEPRAVAGSGQVQDLGGGRVTFQGVTVCADGQTVLDGLDLEVPAGAVLAVVGQSGAGKSTLAALVGRLIEPDHGTIMLDGVPMAEISTATLRQHVGYAFERPALLGGTIGEAIGYACPDASPAAIEFAARVTHADEFIRRLPAGYETALAAAPLSGGEVQRLGLARAVAHGARIVVLDDATSSLDTVTEAQISRALTEALAGRTRIVVAHRATTAARADLVAWLCGGHIRALAPHQELWRDEQYRELFGSSLHSQEMA